MWSLHVSSGPVQISLWVFQLPPTVQINPFFKLIGGSKLAKDVR